MRATALGLCLSLCTRLTELGQEIMNVIKRLITGGGTKEKKKAAKEGTEEYDYEREHCEVDFDKQFEQARRSTSSSVPPSIVANPCEYRGSPSSRGTPTNRSKSPSPFPQNAQKKLLIKQESQVKKASLGTPSSHRKCSEPNWKTRPRQKSPQEQQQQGAAERDRIKRNLTDSQKRKAKEIVESIDWIQPAVVATPQLCYVQPQLVQSQMIVPQIHICEALPIVRPGKALAIIPHGGKGAECPQPVAASGKVVTAATNRGSRE